MFEIIAFMFGCAVTDLAAKESRLKFWYAKAKEWFDSVGK